MTTAIRKYLEENGVKNAQIKNDQSNGVKSLTIQVMRGDDAKCDELLSKIKNAVVRSYIPCKFHITFK